MCPPAFTLPVMEPLSPGGPTAPALPTHSTVSPAARMRTTPTLAARPSGFDIDDQPPALMTGPILLAEFGGGKGLGGFRPAGPCTLEPSADALGHCLDQDGSHFGPGELFGRLLPCAEHLPDLGPRQDDPFLVPVGAGLRRRHLVALLAVEGMLEEQRGDPQLFGVELLEDLLGVVGP